LRSSIATPPKRRSSPGSWGDAATAVEPGAPFRGEVVVFALYYPGNKDAVRQYSDQLSGKVVVDISNPVDTNTWDRLALR
jgi:predicted dinucleotide-binding enzyme